MARRYSEQEQFAKGLRSRALLRFVLLLFAVLTVRVFDLQVVHGERYRQMAEDNEIKIRRERAPRGLILDRNGFVMAGNRPAYALAVVLAETPGDSLFRRQLAEAAGVDEALLAAGLELAAVHPHEPVKILRDIPFETVARVEEHRLELEGVEVEVDPIRFYPCGSMASHLLGYEGEVSETELRRLRPEGYRPGDFLGRTGVEELWEAALRGDDGATFIRVDARGREVGTVKEKAPVRPRPGNNVFLTVDVTLQAAAEKAFEGVRRGACVVLDPQTGGILAAVSRPSFDPNAFAPGIRGDAWRALADDPDLPLLNRAVSASYPPGSTFKIITAACAVDLHRIDNLTRFRACTGGYQYGNRWYHCWKKEGHGRLDLMQAIEMSCDAFFYQVGERLSVGELAHCMLEFGLGRKSGVDLPNEAEGNAPTPEAYDRKFGKGRWSQGLMLNLAIGQGEVLATPLQMAAAVAAIGTGRLSTPHVFLRVETPEGKVLRESRPRSRRVDVSGETLAVLRKAMLGVVSGDRGTGRVARVEGIEVGGKTGTAQNPHGDDHAWFVAMAPVENPRVAVAVIVENGGHGASAAAPLARDILTTFFELERERSHPAALAGAPGGRHADAQGR
jgi:penicillin-binding protein 2